MINFNPIFSPEDFEPVVKEERLTEEPGQVCSSVSFGRETIMLLAHNKTAAVTAVILILLLAGAVVFPVISPFNYSQQDVTFANKPFFSISPNSGLLHIFGTDQLGRDIFVRIWYGARISLLVAGAAAVIDTVAGVLYGSVSGYLGGTADNIMMRILEVVSGIPYLVIVLLLMVVLPQGIGTLIVAYSLVGWTGTARLIRGQVQSLCGKEFMIAARIMGAGMGRIIFRHLIPNMLGVIIVNLTLDIPGIIFTEAFLSMLGMGVPAPYPSLGGMANEGITVFQVYPARLIVPALFICLTMLSFNLLGDKLQDLLNPKTRRTANGKHTKYPKPERVL